MLPQHLRLRKSADFKSIIKHGHKVVRSTLVLYAKPSDVPRFGVIVGKSLGGAVVRNTIKRSLRHHALSLLDFSHPLDVVVRAVAWPGLVSLSEDLQSAWDQMSKQVWT